VSDTDHHFPVMGLFPIYVTAETLGKVSVLASVTPGSTLATNDEAEDACVVLLDAALDAAIAAEVKVTPGIKLAIVPAEPKRRRRAGGKRGSK
jgi:hypothetical protein